jgi:hypothetical protein
MRERLCKREPRARVSKDEDEQSGLPSCFETHRSVLRRWQRLRSRRAAMLLSMRQESVARFGQTNPTAILAKRSQAHCGGCLREGGDPMTTGRCSWVPTLRPLARASVGTTIGWRGGPTSSCSKRTRAHLPCFRPVLYRDRCNFNVSRRGVPSLLTRCDRTDGRALRSRRAAGRSRCCPARHSGRRRCCRCRAPPTTSTAARCCCRFARSRPAFARRRA